MKRKQEFTVTDERLVEAFADLFEQIPPETLEEIEAELRDADLDLDQVAARIKPAIEQALETSPPNPQAEIPDELSDRYTGFTNQSADPGDDQKSAVNPPEEPTTHSDDQETYVDHEVEQAIGKSEDAQMVDLECLSPQLVPGGD
jgi:hypothetical protein